MRIGISIFLGAFICSAGVAQSDKKELDKEAIKSMCGCFDIDFNYTETFSPDTNYEFHKDYHAHAQAEYAFVVEETEDKIVIQHLLVINDSMIIKHWRQDWLYENTSFWEYDADFKWKFVEKSKEDVAGQWTQKVYQVDDSPRYQGSATWVHYDGKHFWEDKSDSPLPRREYSKRSDYNVLNRGNRHEITDYGWLHEQDNTKIVRNTSGDKILAQEKGLNRYKSQDESKCQAAIDWWKDNEEFWSLVREEWTDMFGKKEDVSITKLIDDKMMWMNMFELSGSLKENGKKKTKASIREVLEKYTKS